MLQNNINIYFKTIKAKTRTQNTTQRQKPHTHSHLEQVNINVNNVLQKYLKHMVIKTKYKFIKKN